MEFVGKITEIKVHPEDGVISSILTIEGAVGDAERQMVTIYGKRSIIMRIFNDYGLDKAIKIKIGD